MTMLFRTVKSSVVSILGSAAAGRYRVSGYQEQGLSADEVAGNLRLVQVYYKGGKFPRGASGRGPFAHDVTLQIRLTVSHAASVDLTVLNDINATPVQLEAALAALGPASETADSSMDELFDAVYQVLMDGDNLDLGNKYEVSNRWVEEFEKSEVIPRGEYAVLEGHASLTFRVNEEVGTTDKVGLDFVSTDLSIQDDGDPKAGSEVSY